MADKGMNIDLIVFVAENQYKQKWPSVPAINIHSCRCLREAIESKIGLGIYQSMKCSLTFAEGHLPAFSRFSFETTDGTGGFLQAPAVSDGCASAAAAFSSKTSNLRAGFCIAAEDCDGRRTVQYRATNVPTYLPTDI